MSLPALVNPTETVRVGGQEFTVRGLTRAEALAMRDLGEDVAEIEVHLLAAGFDAGLEETRAWHLSAPTAVVEPLTTAISRLSGLLEDEAGRPTSTPTGAD